MSTRPSTGRPNQVTIDTLVGRLTAKFPGLDLDVSARANDVHVAKIVVPVEARGSGVGTKVMTDLAAVADLYGWTLSVTPSNVFGTAKKELDHFYRGLGYVPNSGKNKDYGVSATMIRKPESRLAHGPVTPDLHTPNASVPDFTTPSASGLELS